MSSVSQYREELIQWIWENLQFDCSNLETTTGEQIQILDPGKSNAGEGPDFLGAQIRIGERLWIGSVEIHHELSGWNQHGHENDEAFNSVILHVVFERGTHEEVVTEDGHCPSTLVLKPYIAKQMHKLLEKKERSRLACAGNISFMNQRAFEKQVEQAHREYLEYKVEELMDVYDPNLPISQAWKESLITGVYRTLGIPANRSQMVQLAQKIFTDSLQCKEFYSFTKQVHQIAFDSDIDFSWKRSGMRPASRPVKRVKQAAAIHFTVSQHSFDSFFKVEPEESWKMLLNEIPSHQLPGKSRLQLVKQIVYLPALYLLGELLQTKKLKKEVFREWCSPGQKIPNEIQAPFKKAGFTLNASTKRVGLAHQYKRYCLERNCYRCEVFKKAIRS